MLSDNGRVLSDKGRVLSDKGLVLDGNKAQDGQVLSDNGIWLIGRGEGGAGRYSVFFCQDTSSPESDHIPPEQKNTYL